MFVKIFYIYHSIQRKQNAGLVFLNGLFSDFVNNISNEDIKVEAAKASTFFCRKRKLSLSQLIVTVMGFTRAGVQVEVDRLFQYLSANKSRVITYSRSAFSQARRKLNANVFHTLRTRQLEYFYKHAAVNKRWYNYRVIAVDGSTLNLPVAKELIDRFGCLANEHRVCVSSRVSIAYDVCNHLTMDAAINPYTMGEKAMTLNHITKLASADTIFVFDRGYTSLFLIKALVEHEAKFCFRISSSFKEIYRQLERASDLDYSFPQSCRYSFNGRSYKLDKAIEGLRIVKIPLSDTEDEILLTNLNDRKLFGLRELKELYQMRWTVEETYKRIKHVCQVEFFTGKSEEAIRQDFLARILLLNFASMIETQQVQPEIEKRSHTNKYPLQANRTQIYAKLKDNLLSILFGVRICYQLERLMKFLRNCYDIVRKNRSVKRKMPNQKKRKALLYKAV